MKRVAILLTLLLLAIICSDASSIPREPCRTKRNRDTATTDAPYVCLDAPIDLPACNFGSETDEETREKSSRQSRQLTDTSTESNNKYVSPFEDNEQQSRAMIIVYKIEGCIPSRLPFVLPTCKQEDSVGKIVQVRRLFPFNVMASSGYNSDTTLVFPEIDMDQWHRFMRGPWTAKNSEDNGDQGDRVNREISQTVDSSDLSMPKISKRKKVMIDNITEKKKLLKKIKKFDWMYGIEEFDENDIFTKFPSVEKKLQSSDERAGDTTSHKYRSSRWNRIDVDRREDSHKNRRVAAESFAKFTEEFPYAKAIPYDPEKLLAAKIDSGFSYPPVIVPHIEKLSIPRRENEFSYSRAVIHEPRRSQSNGIVGHEKQNSVASQRDELPYDAEELGVSRAGSEFPYNRAIPYDPAKLQHLRGPSEFHHSGVFPRESTGSSLNEIVDEDYNYAFPYAKAIPYDPKKLLVARVGSEFPYTRAIPYDPAKLRIATRGSEFPYAKAIPYDPKRLEERWSRIINEGSIPFYTRGLKATDLETKTFDSRDVPFDARMLDAAKEGGKFPYGKAVPDDTSKIIETMKPPKPRDSERIKVPVRYVRTFWNEEIPNFTQKIQMEKNERRHEKIMGSREIQKNIINTGNEDYPNNRARVARSAAESNASSDISAANGHFEIPGRWSEFPYSQAIPFDPSKLRRQRSTMEYDVNSSFPVPRNFPYAKAIPYDPSKLAAFRRKKSNSQQEITIF